MRVGLRAVGYSIPTTAPRYNNPRGVYRYYDYGIKSQKTILDMVLRTYSMMAVFMDPLGTT